MQELICGLLGHYKGDVESINELGQRELMDGAG